MKLSFVSAQSQNSVIFSPTQSYAVQSFNNTSKSTDTATQQLLANQQKQQLKGQNNFVSFQNIQINSPPNNKMNENKQLSLSYKSLLLQSPNQTTQISTVSGRENFQKNLSTSFTKSPKQVTFSDDKSELQTFTQDVINPYSLREARQRQQNHFQQQQQFSKSDKILVEENIQNDNSYNNKNALFLIPKIQIQSSSEEMTEGNSEKLIKQDQISLKCNGENQMNQHSKVYFLSNNCIGERSVIKEVTEEDSDIKAKINHEQNNQFEEGSPQFDLLKQSLMNKEYMEFKNQQQSVFKLPTAQENIDKQEQIKNVIVENKKISMIKNSIKNRLAELEKRIEDANKNNGELHEQLDKIDNHNLQESTSELEDFSVNNSKFMKSFSQNKDIDSNKITPRISNNDEQHQLRSNQINQNTQLFQKTIKYENLNQNPYLIQQTNNFATQKNMFENSRRHSQEGKQNVNSSFTKQNIVEAEIEQNKQFRNNPQNRENTQSASRDDQSNISALVRDFSHIADNKKSNDSSNHNSQNSFSIASEYKKQFIPFQENSKPLSQPLPIQENQQAQNLPPYHHHHSFSFRDRNTNSENDKHLSKTGNKRQKNDDEFIKYYINVQQKIKEYKENSMNSSKQMNQSNENSQEQIRQELLNINQKKYLQNDQLKLNDNKELIRAMAGSNSKNDGFNEFERGHQLDKFMRDQQVVPNKRTQQNNERSRKSFQKSKSHSKDLNDQNELDNSNLSKATSLNRSSSELKTILNDDLNCSLNKHKQLKQIKDQIVDEIGKQKLRLSFEKQGGQGQILHDSITKELSNNKQQQNNNSKIQISSNCNNLSNSFTNKSDSTNQIHKKNNQETKLIYQDSNKYQNILQTDQESKQQEQIIQKQHSQNSFTQQQTPSSSSQRNNSFKLKSQENQINNSSNNLSKQICNNYSKDLQNNSSRSALEKHNFTDRLENGNIPCQRQEENIFARKSDPKDVEKQTFLDNIRDQANYDKNQLDFKENKLYQVVKNQLQEKADINNITSKSTAKTIKPENKPLQEMANDIDFNRKQNNTNNSQNQSDISFSQPKGRLLVRSIADFQVGSENRQNLGKEQVVFKKKINEIQQEINEKESQIKLQNQITECINIYQNQKKNDQMLQNSIRQRSPYNSSNNFFNSSLNNQQNLNKTTQNTLSGLNHTDLEMPSQLDQNKMTNLSMSVSFASPNQRSLSRSKKSVRFLNPQDDKQLVNSFEKAKKAKYQEKVKNIISQKVHNWLNKPSKPQMIFNDSKYRINNNYKQLNSSATLPKNCQISQNIYQK
ncbi:hypothetical protein ABPG72_022033 [Tetrahymena utriculariae]